jgi:hypothetical protein
MVASGRTLVSAPKRILNPRVTLEPGIGDPSIAQMEDIANDEHAVALQITRAERRGRSLVDRVV